MNFFSKNWPETPSIHLEWKLTQSITTDVASFSWKQFHTTFDVKYIPGQDNTVADYLFGTLIKADTIQLSILQEHEITNNLKGTADRLQTTA